MDEELRRLITSARAHYHARDWDAAEKVLVQVTERHRGFADVWSMLGVIWHGQGKLVEAQGAFEQAMALAPGYTEAALNLAVTYNDLGKYKEARDVYARVIQRTRAAPRSLDPFVKGKLANLHAEVAAAYTAHALYPEAVREYHHALELCPTFGDLRTRLALVLRDAGELGEAARELEIVKTTQPRYLPARIALGTTLYMLGRRDDAAREWQAVLAEDPENKAAHMYLRVTADAAVGASGAGSERSGDAPIAAARLPSEGTLNEILDGLDGSGRGGGAGGGGSSST
jgi:tetratricopeptide (TPR) repeat protein